MKKINTTAFALCLLGALPMAVTAHSYFGPREGERELYLSGTGSSDQAFNSGSFGVT